MLTETELQATCFVVGTETSLCVAVVAKSSGCRAWAVDGWIANARIVLRCSLFVM